MFHQFLRNSDFLSDSNGIGAHIHLLRTRTLNQMFKLCFEYLSGRCMCTVCSYHITYAFQTECLLHETWVLQVKLWSVVTSRISRRSSFGFSRLVRRLSTFLKVGSKLFPKSCWFYKILTWAFMVSAPLPSPPTSLTIPPPPPILMGGRNLKICQKFVGQNYFLHLWGWG